MARYAHFVGFFGCVGHSAQCVGVLARMHPTLFSFRSLLVLILPPARIHGLRLTCTTNHGTIQRRPACLTP